MMDPQSIYLGISNIFCGLLFTAISIPLLNGSIKMNRYYGIRFKKSYESEENWYKINKFGAKRLIIWSIPLLLIGSVTFFLRVNDHSVLKLIIALAPLIVIIPAIESYVYAKRL
ncbi:hypothetical protein C6A37_06480 [Desulfobacteraceae bacterium SEEP-SAG9]|nr:hypothetical protein C6A37_06480 [Desulfobacteraceae bacterium SEEP-SAG9]